MNLVDLQEDLDFQQVTLVMFPSECVTHLNSILSKSSKENMKETTVINGYTVCDQISELHISLSGNNSYWPSLLSKTQHVYTLNCPVELKSVCSLTFCFSFSKIFLDMEMTCQGLVVVTVSAQCWKCSGEVIQQYLFYKCSVKQFVILNVSTFKHSFYWSTERASMSEMCHVTAPEVFIQSSKTKNINKCNSLHFYMSYVCIIFIVISKLLKISASRSNSQERKLTSVCSDKRNTLIQTAVCACTVMHVLTSGDLYTSVRSLSFIL